MIQSTKAGKAARTAKSASKGAESEIRIIVEVDGNPVGILDLDVDRLWPLINHRRRDAAPAEWIDRARFRTAVRAAVARNLTQKLQTHMYQALGKEIVRAELNLETMVLKAEAAAQTFGRTKREIAAMAANPAARLPISKRSFGKTCSMKVTRPIS